jgi:hypothetical protein
MSLDHDRLPTGRLTRRRALLLWAAVLLLTVGSLLWARFVDVLPRQRTDRTRLLSELKQVCSSGGSPEDVARVAARHMARFEASRQFTGGVVWGDAGTMYEGRWRVAISFSDSGCRVDGVNRGLP